MPITAALLDPQNGDRVRLSAALRGGCTPVDYMLRPVAAITDLAAAQAAASPMRMDLADPGNLPAFSIGASITITLGASG